MSQRTRDLDKHVSRRIRERRLMLGLTQADLASMLGISFQQAHKYEIGSSKIAAGRLFEISQHLDVPVAYFYEVSPEGLAQSSRNRLCLEVVRNFLLIKNETHRTAITNVARALATVPSRADDDTSGTVRLGKASRADDDDTGDTVSPG